MTKKIPKSAKIALTAILILIVGFGAGFGIFSIWAVNTDVLKDTGMKMIAHRGLSGEYTENTMSAFLKAAECAEFFGIETDVHVTKDGYLVCNHDEEVHYEDGTDLTIAENTLETLQSKPVKTKFKTDDRVALFDDYLKACKDGGKRPIIEIKAPLTKEEVEMVLAAVDRSMGRENVTIISFMFDQLELVKSIDPAIYQMLLVNNPFMVPTALENGYSIGCLYFFVTAPMVDEFHEKGLEVNAWTCNDNVTMAFAKNAGADYITTNVRAVL